MYLPARNLKSSKRPAENLVVSQPVSRPSCDEARERIAAVRLKLQTVTQDEDAIGAAKGMRSALQLGSL
jgi:hypothetical protein